MTERAPESDAVDRWLREGLEPEREAARRIASQALSEVPGRNPALMWRRWAPLGATLLVVAFLVSIWTRGGGVPAVDRKPIRITNFGELVTAVDPGGGVWLYAPAHVTDADSPHLIITLGEANAD